MKQRRGIRSPRKVVIRAGIFLLLGAIVNVAVAWGLAWRNPSPSKPSAWLRSSLTYVDWRGAWNVQLDIMQAFGAERVLCHCRHKTNPIHQSLWAPVYDRSLESVTPDWALAALPRAADSPTAVLARIIDRRGWPFLSLQSAWESKTELKRLQAFPWMETATEITTSACILMAGPIDDRGANKFWPRLLLLCPTWPGFAINTLFYAAILWLLFSARLVLPRYRRLRRIKRGLCSACAYPIGASDLCTECGKPVNARSVEPAPP